MYCKQHTVDNSKCCKRGTKMMKKQNIHQDDCGDA